MGKRRRTRKNLHRIILGCLRSPQPRIPFLRATDSCHVSLHTPGVTITITPTYHCHHRGCMDT
jgi:hypothetical protein